MRCDVVLRIVACTLALCCAGGAQAWTAEASALRSEHGALRDAFASSPFRRPLVVQSSESDDALKGEVYAIVEQPFGNVAQALRDKTRWCEVLILHLNVKRCRTAGEAPHETLGLVIGRKAQQSAENGQPMEFAFTVPLAGADFLRVRMAADSGPLGTRDHRLTLEAAPLDNRRSIVHLSYGYGYGAMARLATQAYLATAGRDKVGFTVVGKSDAGQPVFIDGVRGLVERNAMRYYLAIEAYFGALSAPPQEQQDKRLRDWFALTERTPTQLHEIDRDEYLAMKRHEVQAQ
jgi:hypothetical protein